MTMRQTLFLSLILAVPFRRYSQYISWIALLIGVPPALAHEEEHLDMRPQDVYNATTTLFTTQATIQHNLGGYKAIADDMSIGGMHRFTFVQRHGNRIQNLGNNGTATKPIFYAMPQNIGLTSGFHAYDIYFRGPNQFRYYDTKSPYSKMYVMLARFGSFYADVCHSRNVTPHWNIGANFRNIMTDKEWIPNELNDKHVVAYGLDLFTHYKTENDQYQLLAYFLTAKHRVRETGGIYTLKYASSNDEHMLWRHNMENRLKGRGKNNPESSDARKHFHLYHELALAEQLWLYHELDTQKKKHQFKAASLSGPMGASLGGQSTDATRTVKTAVTMWEMQNALGMKGHWRDWFYTGNYRHKKIECGSQQENKSQALHEHAISLQTRYQLTDKVDRLHLAGEYLWSGFYKARIAYEGRFWNLACERVRHKPSFLVQRYQGYYRNWDEQFVPPTATRISSGFQLTDNRVQLRTHGSYTRVDNHIYFAHQAGQRHAMIATPKQAAEHADIIAIDVDLGLALSKHIHCDSELTVANTLGPSAHVFNIPTFLVNTRLYYTSTTAAGNGTFETGIDVHWKSSYKADAYDPVTQQFYLQDEFNVYGYPIIDLFLDFRIKNFSAFLKFSHCNESWLAPAPGYFVTPLYPGQKKAFDIGISWSFFD